MGTENIYTEKQDIVNSSSNLQKSKHKDLYEMQFNGLSLIVL